MKLETVREEFDIVVLSIGLCQSRESINSPGNWVSTSMPRVSRDQQFLAPSDSKLGGLHLRCFHSPKDIPSS